MNAFIIGVLLALPLQPSSGANMDEPVRSRFQLRSEIRADFHSAHKVIYEGWLEPLEFRLTDFQLGILDRLQLSLLVGAIKAQYGYSFTDSSLREHFSGFAWYEPLHEDVEDSLRPVDHHNLEKIQLFLDFEPRESDIIPDPGFMVGVWHGSPAVGSGYSRRFFFFEDGRFTYASSQMDGSERMLEMSGNWEISECYLDLEIQSRVYLFGGVIVPPHTSYGSDYVIENGEERVEPLNPALSIRLPIHGFEEHDRSLEVAGLGIAAIDIGTGRYWRIDTDPDRSMYQ